MMRSPHRDGVGVDSVRPRTVTAMAVASATLRTGKTIAGVKRLFALTLQAQPATHPLTSIITDSTATANVIALKSALRRSCCWTTANSD